jgi:hypothetical protein
LACHNRTKNTCRIQQQGQENRNNETLQFMTKGT